MDDSLRRNAERTSRNIFFGSFILVVCFIIAGKLSQKQALKLIDTPMPELSCRWHGEELTGEKLGGKKALLYFYKEGVKVSGKLLIRSMELQRRLPDDMVTILVAERRPVSIAPPEMFFICIGDGTNRKRYRNGSYANYYIADRLSIIRHVGDVEEEPDREMEETVRGMP